MLILMTSTDAVFRNAQFDPAVVSVLIDAKNANNPIAFISNRNKPSWFDGLFGNSGVQFIIERGRQNGRIVTHNAEHYHLNPYDIIVLAAKDEDIQMGKNGGALLVAAGWATSERVKQLGIKVDSPEELSEVIRLISGWNEHWWYSGNAQRYNVKILADLSTYSQALTQQIFGAKVTDTVKNGGSRLNALLAVTSRSLLKDNLGTAKNLVWGTYPSSASNNKDDDVLSDFTHRLRTTVSRVQFSERGQPLFIRHYPSQKRSAGGAGDRTDPTNQILTIHLNPFYRDSNRLVGKHVIVIDDCATYGVSFGVAAAFLRKAGAAFVTGIALGKFGSQFRHYEIDLHSDPYSPVLAGAFTCPQPQFWSGANNHAAQHVLHTLIP